MFRVLSSVSRFRQADSKPETRNSELQHDSPDVVLLHGWGLNAAIWADLAARLAPRFRVRALDLPGYGTCPACRPYTLRGLAGAVARRAPRRCHVVGWSLGGQVALAWARRAPRQVGRLALISTTPSFVQRADWPCAVAPQVLEEFARALAADHPGTLRRFLALQARGDERGRQVVAALKRRLLEPGAPPAPVLEQGLKILLTVDLRAELAEVTQPALVLHGERDRLTPVAAGRYLAQALPAARFVPLTGCAHAPFLSQPERVTEALQEFLDE